MNDIKRNSKFDEISMDGYSGENRGNWNKGGGCGGGNKGGSCGEVNISCNTVNIYITC